MKNNISKAVLLLIALAVLAAFLFGEFRVPAPAPSPKPAPAAAPAPSPAPKPTPTPAPAITQAPEEESLPAELPEADFLTPEATDYLIGVQQGNVRYVSQLSHPEKSGWGKYGWRAGYECSTACISMALSYIGIDESPEALLDYSSSTVFKSNYGLKDRVEFSPLTVTALPAGKGYDILQQMLELYMEDGTMSHTPVLLYISGNNNHHALLVIGRDGEDYLVLDPANKGVHRLQITEDGKVAPVTEKDYLGRYTANGKVSAYISALAQWSLKLPEEEETAEGPPPEEPVQTEPPGKKS